jgi:hypothetical protein
VGAEIGDDRPAGRAPGGRGGGQPCPGLDVGDQVGVSQGPERRGGDLSQDIQDGLGHADPRTTLSYDHGGGARLDRSPGYTLARELAKLGAGPGPDPAGEWRGRPAAASS